MKHFFERSLYFFIPLPGATSVACTRRIWKLLTFSVVLDEWMDPLFGTPQVQLLILTII